MSDSGMGEDPLIQPRLVRMLKDRPRLIDFGVRQEILDELDVRICRRRSPDEVANRLSEQVSNEVQNATRPVMKNRVKNQVDKLNKNQLRRL